MFSLDEIKEVRGDVFAKAETVKTLGEEIADLTAFNVTRVGRFAGADLQQKMIEARNRIKQLLQSLGSSEEKIARISNQIEDMILHDLKNNVASETDRITHKAITSGRQFNREQVQKRIRELLNEYDRKSIITYLKEQNLYEDELTPLLDKIDKFIQTRTL